MQMAVINADLNTIHAVSFFVSLSTAKPPFKESFPCRGNFYTLLRRLIMTYTVFGENIIRLSLEEWEFERIFGRREGIEPSAKSRLALKLLLKKALKDLKLPPDGNFSAEFSKNLAGGCDIYFKKGFYDGSEPCIFYFEGIKEALSAAKSTCELSFSEKSRFFNTDLGYCLVFEEGISKRVYNSLNKFAKSLRRGKLEVVKAEEHGRELIPFDAVSVLADLY